MGSKRKAVKLDEKPSGENKSKIAVWIPLLGSLIVALGSIAVALINKSPTLSFGFTPNSNADITPLVVTATNPSASSQCPEGMAYIPGGTFTLGGTDDNAKDDEKPVRHIYLDPFCMDITEVNNKAYNIFLTSASVKQTRSIPDDNMPVVNVTWFEAKEYCEYYGKTLPNEYQWEKAARGEGENIYPWGNEKDLSKANIENLQATRNSVYEFKSGASPYGILNMAGNVAEWTLDWYVSNWYETLPENGRNPAGPETGEIGTKVVRGGSANEAWNSARVSARLGKVYPSQKTGYIGFRCMSLPLR